jgi:hypothetical protein
MSWWRDLLLMPPSYGSQERGQGGVQVVPRQQPARQAAQLVRQPVVVHERAPSTQVLARQRTDDGGRSR